MLAGLIFATENADDRPGTLAATLPFGGLTLVEFQARLLIAAGASQILVVVARLTPELLGAINRIGKRVTVDAVRTAAEATEKLHPLARILVVADGLVTTGPVLAPFAAEGGDAMLVIDEADAEPDFERVGAKMAWAGVARLDPRRIAEVAELPRDYDFQSTLLRVAVQGRAEQIPLNAEDVGGAHGIERDSRALTDRGSIILAARVSQRIPWIDRFVIGPLARLALPPLVSRMVPTVALSGVGALLGLMGLTAEWFGWTSTGLGLVLAAILVLATASPLAWLRDEEAQARLQHRAIDAFAGVSVLLLGRTVSLAAGNATGWIAAAALIVIAALAERAADDVIRRRWWATPAAYPLLLLPFALGGSALVGLGVAALYASATLSAAIEALREKP